MRYPKGSIPNPTGYAHRPHRTKKNRNYNPEKVQVLDKKKKLEEIIIDELEDELYESSNNQDN